MVSLSWGQTNEAISNYSKRGGAIWEILFMYTFSLGVPPLPSRGEQGAGGMSLPRFLYTGVSFQNFRPHPSIMCVSACPNVQRKDTNRKFRMPQYFRKFPAHINQFCCSTVCTFEKNYTPLATPFFITCSSVTSR